MPYLSGSQRSSLERTVVRAREVAMNGAREALQGLAVDRSEPFTHLSLAQRELRNDLRHKGRLLGDERDGKGIQTLERLAYELAYESWHKMLFARFLEANHLLMHPTHGVAVTLEECQELAEEEGFPDKWSAVTDYASKMLPALFRPSDPVMQVSLPLEFRVQLENLLTGLEDDLFVADDALGWVYQYWQSAEKERINQSGDKIDGERLPAVTQLFTEPYMVDFLIDNSVGAWWTARHPGQIPPVPFHYLRTLPDGTPAAGGYETWPTAYRNLTYLDPCMGSGHIVVRMLQVLVPLRMADEGLTVEEATDRVLSENLHGLELDPRCTQIAAFNLALTAWKLCGGYRTLPELHLACSGLGPTGTKESWRDLSKLAAEPNLQARLKEGLEFLYLHFKMAPQIGSLMNPGALASQGLFGASFEEILPYLEKASALENDTETRELGVFAAGMAKAGALLAKKYVLQITNVPYLSRGKQDTELADFCEDHYPDAKGDLANVFLERMLRGAENGGMVMTVMPQNWLFLKSYKKCRESLLQRYTWNYLARLGPGAFSQISGEVVKAILISLTQTKPKPDHLLTGLDVSDAPSADAKEEALKTTELKTVSQKAQLGNPDARVLLDESSSLTLLNEYADCLVGVLNGDTPRFVKEFFEIPKFFTLWSKLQTTTENTIYNGGYKRIIYFDEANGHLREEEWIRREKLHNSDQRGQSLIGKKGITISAMGSLPATLFLGSRFDSNVAVISPHNPAHLPAIWCFCSSPQFNEEVRKIDQKLNVTNATLVKVPFDLEHWTRVAEEKYPNGLPAPYSDDPTQWLFHGHPEPSTHPVQVALARLMGYTWPAESDPEMELDPRARALIEAVKPFEALVDQDGIVCIPAVNGEPPAAEQLRKYLQAVYGEAWSAQTLERLLREAGSSATTLEDYLRHEAFKQHCDLFQQRPFVWHIWDGRRDGFSAFVHYHRLTAATLQRLLYTYLGDWIRQCEARVQQGQGGSDGQLQAALALQKKLEAILEGEAPYDVFVRWKPIEEHPIGWNPDLNDGVRLNIRPFLEADVLRHKPRIKWGVDRGKNPAGAPWGEVRDNDRHLTLAEKRAARDA